MLVFNLHSGMYVSECESVCGCICISVLPRLLRHGDKCLNSPEN